MKKKLFLLLFLTTALGAFAQEYKDWSKWSITLEGGGNMIDGDVFQSYNQVSPTSNISLSLGGSIEYTLTPAWSMGVEYYYLPLKASNTTPTYNVNTKLHNVDYFMSVNLIKLFFRHSKSKFGLWPSLGIGGAFYNVDYTTDGTSLQDNQNQKDVNYQKDNCRSVVIPVGVIAEYNFTKNLAIGTKIQYRMHSDDNLDGRDNRGVTNDAVSLATLQLRWKFNARHNDHTRNISVAQFDNDVTREELDSLKNKLQKQIDGIPTPFDPTDLNRRVKKLEDYLDIDGPDDDKDGVANSRDREPNTPEGSLVNFWGQKIDNKVNDGIDESAVIYFDFDKTDLDNEALKAIDLAAKKLQADPSLMVEVRGFTDNMGTNAYNADLSQRRADKVKNELVKVYGIDSKRIIPNGKGKFNPKDRVVPYRFYRTSVFFYSK